MRKENLMNKKLEGKELIDAVISTIIGITIKEEVSKIVNRVLDKEYINKKAIRDLCYACFVLGKNGGSVLDFDEIMNKQLMEDEDVDKNK